MQLFDAAILTLIGILGQAIGARKDWHTWWSFAFSLGATTLFYAWAHGGFPATLRHADVAPWGDGYLIWLGNTAIGHKLASAAGLKTDSLGGSDATPAVPPDPPDAARAPDPAPAGGQ